MMMMMKRLMINHGNNGYESSDDVEIPTEIMMMK